MNPVSAVDEKQRLEVDKIRMDTLATLTDIGKMLGMEGQEWHEYLLKRSMIPAHLFRRDGKGKISGIIKGVVRVEESKILARLEDMGMMSELSEGEDKEYDKEYKVRDFIQSSVHITESRCKEIDNVIAEKLDREDRIVLQEFFISGKHMFSHKVGSNCFSSHRLRVSPESLPLHALSGTGTLVESKQVAYWNSDEKELEVIRTKNLMTETIRKINAEAKEEVKNSG